MPPIDHQKLLLSLLSATRPEDVAALLVTIGDRSELDLDEPIGASGLVWHAVGDYQGNLSAINLATKPGRSLTERVTNAIDALFELRAHQSTSELPRSPRIAAERWFGRPVSGAETGLFRWDYSAQQADRQIFVAMLESGREEAPTVDVLDLGIGINAPDFQSTILSLRGGNKIKKFYVVGAFGQGGSSTLAFSDYVLYISRHFDNPRMVSFTIVKVLRLGDTYKEDCFVYLALPGENGQVTVPTVDMGNRPITLYPSLAPRGPEWLHGTLVRHFAFKLPSLAANLQAVPGNLYHFLHVSLFDPLLPFRLFDLRRNGKERDELISGSRNRLMKYTLRGEPADADDLESRELKHFRPMEYVTPYGEQDPTIGIEYWVVLNWRKAKGAARILRPSSSELFVQRNHPIVGSLFGQNQGELTSAILRKLNLGMVAKHIVVHVDASRTPNHVRRELFSSTREGFKDGTVLGAIERVLTKMFSEDDQLTKIERELAERIVERENARTEDEVKREISKLLVGTGMSMRELGPSAAPGAGGVEVVQKRKGALFRQKDPLPTLPFPEVTTWKMVVPTDKMDIHLGDYETVLVETDADAEYDRKGLVSIRTEPPFLEIGTKAPLSGGRVRWRLRTVDTSVAGQTGVIIATLTRPDGRQLQSSLPFEILAQLPEPARRSLGQVPPFEVLPINPTADEDQEIWAQLWPQLADETDMAKLSAVAYRTQAIGEKRIVYFNVAFGPFRQMEDGYLTKSPVFAEMFRVQYKIWVGYHALLQEADSADERAEAGDSDLVERTLSEETVRVATMQAKQAAQFVELKKLTLKPREDEAEG